MKLNSSFLVLVAAILWGTIGLFFYLLSDVGFTPMQAVLLRVGTAAISMLVLLFMTDRSLLRVRLRDCWCFVGTGVFSLVFFIWCYFTAIKMTSMAVAAVLLYTMPIFVMLMSVVLFHEAMTGKKVVALLMTFIGCMCVAGVFSGSEAKFSVLGILIGIGSGVGYALYSIFGRYALFRGYHPLTISVYTFLFATIGALPLSGIWEVAPLLLKPKALVGALGLGIVCSAFPFALYTKGLQGMDTSKAAILATAEPAVAALISFFVFHESLWGFKGIGILLIFGAVILLSMPVEKKMARKNATVSPQRARHKAVLN